jgi:hypothetical protein
MIEKILAALLLLSLAGFGVQTWRVSHYESQAHSLKQSVDTFESAQKTNMATIVALQATNQEWAQKCAADSEQALKESSDARAYAQQQEMTAMAAKKALHDLSISHPQVRDWAGTLVPPDVVRILTGNTH